MEEARLYVTVFKKIHKRDKKMKNKKPIADRMHPAA